MADPAMSPALARVLSETAAAIDTLFDQLLPEGEGAEGVLLDAMRYAFLAGGKRIRPFMVTQGASLFGVDPGAALRAGVAIEAVHCYSLVHDDLPAMDDDDLRRGKPTTHKQYDEATAILVGDALLTMAFEVLGHAETHRDPHVRIELVSTLARDAGYAGMVGGQMIDLSNERGELDMGGITRLQQMKTGALIRWSCEAGGMLGQATEGDRHALTSYAHDLGLAFQIADDLLDAEGDPEEMGKAARKDFDKPTFVAMLGVERARTQAEMLADQAVQHLDHFDSRADLLRDLAKFVINRRS